MRIAMTLPHRRKASLAGRIRAALGLGLLSGCGILIPADPSPFVPAAALTGSAAMAVYEAQLDSRIAFYDAGRLRHIASLPEDWPGPLPDWIAPRLSEIDARAEGLDGGRIAPAPGLTPGSETWPGRWREAQAFLYLGDTVPAATGPFRLPDQNAVSTLVHFRSLASGDAAISATCDGDVHLQRSGSDGYWPADTAFSFSVAAGERDATALRLPPLVTACALTVRVGSDAPFAIDLRREADVDPALAAMDSRFDICAQPPERTSDPLAAAFFAGRWLSQTCAMPPSDLRLLPDSRGGFNAKIEALTGMRLPDSAFDAGDPNVPLDFTNAPRLDLIYLSYLDLKADFSGAIISRALRYHAARGTVIRILVSEVLELDKDRALYEGLAAAFPNVQLQLFSWEPPQFAPAAQRFAALHRVHHIKLFATLSPDPGRSRAILGGRNIHDGFLFSEALDLSAFPELQDYGEPGELSLAYFSTYHDFEVEIRDDAAVRTLAAHMSTFWHRDFGTTVFRPFSIGTPAPGPAAQTGMRHFMSVPYLDGGALERYWVELIDSARESIEIVTPYLNPTPAIEAALNRALARGIEVTIVARVELFGDLGGRLMTEMNMLFVEDYADRLTLYEYDPPDVVLHAKMLLIDGRLSIVSSVNLNRRSFLHDTENGLAVLDPGFYRRLRAVVQGYIDQAVRLGPEDIDIRPATRRLFNSDRVRDLF